MKMQKIIPALPVKNIREACEFYSAKLGFSIRHQEESFAIAVRDTVEIHLWAACDESWRIGPALPSSPVRSGAESFLAGTAGCRIEVDGIEELYEEYKNKDVLHSADTKLVEQYWGHREFAAVDHHRNLLTFYEVMSK